MDAYIFQAALLCADCGVATQEQLRPSIKSLHPDFNEAEESSFDSDYFPKGPYSQGGGEADCPQHCDHCGVFLENPLTGDGAEYVREAAEQFGIPADDSSWEEIAQKAENSGKPVVAEWIRYYLAWGQ